MSLTGNIIDVDKIQLTDTFQTWFEKTNELIDAVNPVNIYDLDAGIGTDVTYGLSGTEYNGVKSVNVVAGYGVAVGAGTTFPWSGVVGVDYSGISGDSYTLTGNRSLSANYISSEVHTDNDYFLVLDSSDTTQTASGTVKRVRAGDIIPRTIYQPNLTLNGTLRILGDLTVQGAGANLAASTLAVANRYIYLAVTGASAPQFTAINLNDAGLVIGISGGFNREITWFYNSNNDYISFNTNYGGKAHTNSLVNSRFISRNFVGGDGATSNAFVFEAAGGSATRFWLTEASSTRFFGIVKTAASSNVNFFAYNGGGQTSIAHFIAGATSVYAGVTAQVFVQNANVDMLDGAHAVTGASAWTIPVGDALGQMHPDRHNAGQIRRRFTQANHGLTTGEAVTIVPTGFVTAGSLTSANAGSSLFEAIGIVDRVLSASEVSVTMKGFVQLSANGLKGIGASAVTGQYYILDWVNSGGLTTNMSVPTSKVYQPVFLALTPNSGIVYGNEGDTVFTTTTDQVYLRSLVPIGTVQSYAGSVAGLTMGLSGGALSVSDVSYNENWLPCDGRAISTTGASGFVDLFQLLGYTYSVRGTVTSSNGQAGFVIRSDRDTRNLQSYGSGLGSGTTRIVQRSGASAGTQLNLAYTSFTADSSTVTIMGAGLTTGTTQIANGTIVDILTPKVDSLFFLPDLRGRVPFGELSSLGLRGENINLGVTGATGATASFHGGLYTNYIIRSRREADALILTGHNHDSRYLRKDANDIVSPGVVTTLATGIVSERLNVNLGMSLTGGASITGGLTAGGPVNMLSNANINAGLSVTGGISTTGGTRSFGPAMFGNGMSITGGLSVTGGATVFGNVSAGNGLSVTGGASLTGGMLVYGDIEVYNGGFIRSGGLSVTGGIAGSIVTPSQTNITSLGTLSFLNTAGMTSTQRVTISSGGLSVAGNIDGTIGTAAQPNITSLGTLTSLNTAGLTSTQRITVTNGGVSITGGSVVFGGNEVYNGTIIRSGGISVTGGIAGTIVTPAQTSITTLGSLLSLNTAGMTSTQRVTVSNGGLSVVGGINGTINTAAQPNITSLGSQIVLNTAGLTSTQKVNVTNGGLDVNGNSSFFGNTNVGINTPGVTFGASGNTRIEGDVGIGMNLAGAVGSRILAGNGANTARGKLEVVGDIRIPSGGFFVNSNITIPTGLTATIANGENALMSGTLTVASGATLLVQTGGTIIVL